MEVSQTTTSTVFNLTVQAISMSLDVSKVTSSLLEYCRSMPYETFESGSGTPHACI